MVDKIEKTFKLVEQMVAEKLIPGAAVACITQEGVETQYIGAYGYEEPFSSQPITRKSIYDLASVTKLIGTTSRLYQLLEEQKLSLEMTVSDILPQFPKALMTVEDLMTHRSGLPADFPHWDDLSWEVIQSYVQAFEYDGPKEMVYSDIGYILLGLIIEQLDQQNLERTFYQHICVPYNLGNITYFPINPSLVVPTEQRSNGTYWQGHVHDEKGRMLERPIGSAGLFATLENVIQYVQQSFIVAEGENSMFSSEIVELIMNTNKEERTLGWAWLPNNENRKILYHTGFTGTSIGIDVEAGKALILLANRVHPTREDKGFLAARTHLYEMFFEEKNK